MPKANDLWKRLACSISEQSRRRTLSHESIIEKWPFSTGAYRSNTGSIQPLSLHNRIEQ
jgi:hypothetical protein